MKSKRFSVEECEKCSDDRVFKNGKCVHNNILDMAYSVDEIVEVLNNRSFQEEFYRLVEAKIYFCQAMFKETNDPMYKEHETVLRVLEDELRDAETNIKHYWEFLDKWIKHRK